MTRAFTAIPIPEKQREKLEEIQKDLPGNKIRPEKLHITLEFFENLDELEVAEIKTFLESLDTDSFEVKIQGLGAFPSKNYIRVLWAGVESDEIRTLFEKASGHEVESDNDHEFKPHITLSRLDKVRKGEKQILHKILESFEDESIGSFEAEKLVFYESEMTSEGSNYRELYVKEL